jgi:glucosyl-dolichyl phosphate glucuronosyltransferase
LTTEISISIVICTCNRAASLQQTLDALGRVKIPAGCTAEVIVVDNASTDSTVTVAKNAALENMQAVYLFEPRKGKSNALNAAIAMARGATFVFTDDDVVPSEDWLEQIMLCFDETQCDALVGKIELAPHLERSWMGKLEKYYLAIPDFESGQPIHWIGANAAFQRRCLQRVRQFDPELGSGALGNAEDTLFGSQLVESGFKMEYARRAVVIHQPDQSRLTRQAWLHAARLRAQSEAYISYHWEHSKIKAARVKYLWFLTKLSLRKMLQRLPPLNAEGCPRWEWSYTYDMAFYRQYCIEQRRPRNYARLGLEKLGPAKPPTAMAISQTAGVRPREHSSV